jgi:hypothetical protein
VNKVRATLLSAFLVTFPVQLIPAQTQLECQGFSLLDRETLDDWEALEASVGPTRGKGKETNVYENLCW